MSKFEDHAMIVKMQLVVGLRILVLVKDEYDISNVVDMLCPAQLTRELDTRSENGLYAFTRFSNGAELTVEKFTHHLDDPLVTNPSEQRKTRKGPRWS